jgi:hypothetical protein
METFILVYCSTSISVGSCLVYVSILFAGVFSSSGKSPAICGLILHKASSYFVTSEILSTLVLVKFKTIVCPYKIGEGVEEKKHHQFANITNTIVCPYVYG